MVEYDDGGKALMSLPVVEQFGRSFDRGVDKRVPSLELVRLERWHFGGKAGRTLDYGCGTGVNLVYLLDRGHEMVGIDAAKGSIRLVESKIQLLPKEQAKATTLHHIDPESQELPAEAASFDNVICFSVLSLLGTPERISRLLSEFRRVLKPGGKAILDINGPTSAFARLGEAQGNDIYEYTAHEGDIPFQCYCPPDKEAFVKMLEPYFQVDDIGYCAYQYWGSEIYEFIACVSKS